MKLLYLLTGFRTLKGPWFKHAYPRSPTIIRPALILELFLQCEFPPLLTLLLNKDSHPPHCPSQDLSLLEKLALLTWRGTQIRGLSIVSAMQGAT